MTTCDLTKPMVRSTN